MALTPCGSILIGLTKVLTTSSGKQHAQSYLKHEISNDTFLGILEASLSPADAGVLREELKEFPEGLLDVILQVWALSESAGQSFQVQSRAPDRPLDLARRGSVRVTVELDEAGVILALEHIPGRHAKWLTSDKLREAAAA